MDEFECANLLLSGQSFKISDSVQLTADTYPPVPNGANGVIIARNIRNTQYYVQFSCLHSCALVESAHLSYCWV